MFMNTKFNAYFFVVIVLSVVISGCVTAPAMTKVELKGKPFSEFQKKANYLVLARYWDDHATKAQINYAPASFLTIWEKERKAELSLGLGPYYGMIELISIDEHTTLVRCYSWGYLAKFIDEWSQLIEMAPEDKRSR